MIAKINKRVCVCVPPEFLELAKIIGLPPAAILEQFIHDLLKLPQSGGSDEREKASEYFLRTSMVGLDSYQAAARFIGEYRCS